MVGVVDFTKEYAGGGGKIVRIFNRSVFFDVIKDGKLQPLDGKALRHDERLRRQAELGRSSGVCSFPGPDADAAPCSCGVGVRSAFVPVCHDSSKGASGWKSYGLRCWASVSERSTRWPRRA